jgi:hypothetical protein
MAVFLEISMISNNDRRNFNLELVVDVDQSNSEIRSVIETMCDVKVTKIKRVTKFNVPDTDTSNRGITFNAQNIVDGNPVMSTKLFLPRVRRNYSIKAVEFELKKICGNKFTITGSQERI